VHNDPGGLDRLVAQAQDMGLFDQIVVVDDGSSPPVAPRPGVTLIRQPRARGSGVARNRGLRAVTCDYVLFFDADDALTAELPLLLADLAGAGHADICLFRHADSRVTAEGLWGQPDWDERFWEEAGIGPGVLCEPVATVWPILAQTANYPWNRIYRVQFLRRHRVACAPTLVHNDLPLHWLGLMRAARVLVSGRVCAVHHVAPAVQAGGQLTHRSGAVRLQLFTALAPVLRAARGRADWQAALRRFLPGLFAWARARVDAGNLAAFDAQAHQVMAGLGADVPGGFAPVAQRAVRASPRTGGGDARTPPGYLAPKDEGGAIAFVLLLRDAGSTLADLARDLAAVARPGDHVIIIDDSGDNGTAPRLGRFLAEEGFPCPVTVRVTGGRGDGDLGVAVNLALAELAVSGAGRARVLFLAGGTRIDAGAFGAVRAGATAPLILLPWDRWDLDLGRPSPAPSPGRGTPLRPGTGPDAGRCHCHRCRR
jgi:Glycosyl transferase family 2